MTRREAMAAGLLLAGGRAALGAADDPTAAARAAVAAYGKNLRAFPHLRCVFHVRRGSAPAADEAKAGRITVEMEDDFTYSADGPRVRFDTHGTPVQEGLRGKQGRPLGGNLNAVQIDFFAESVYLTNGAEELVHDTGMTANLFSPDLPASPDPAHPLATGVFDWHLRRTPDRMAALPDGYNFVGEGPQTLDGRPTVRARFFSVVGDAAWVVDFDPARGHLPYRSQVLDRSDDGKGPLRVTNEAWVLDAKDCGKGRFFPTRVVDYWPYKHDEPMVDVRETVVKELDADFKPTPATFVHRPPDHTGVIYSRSKVCPSISLAAGEAIRAEDLPDLVKRLKAKLPPGQEG